MNCTDLNQHLQKWIMTIMFHIQDADTGQMHLEFLSVMLGDLAFSIRRRVVAATGRRE